MAIDDDKTEKTPAEIASDKRQAERDAIKVTKPTVEKEEIEENEDEKVNDDETSGTGDKEDVQGTKEGTEGETKKDEEETEPEVKSIEKLERTIARLQKRLDKETGSKKDLTKELNAAKSALEAKQADGEIVLTEEEVERRSEEKANRKVAETEFVKACNRIFDDAIKIDKQFKVKVDAMAEDIGPIPSIMIGILDDIDNGAAVLSHLTNNVDEAEDIYKLSPAKMAIELAKISTKVVVKPLKKDISKVPPPNEPIGGGSVKGAFDPYDTKTNKDKDWIEKRNKQVAEKRAAKLAAMR